MIEDPGPAVCYHCGKPILGSWIIEIDERTYHAARNYRGPDRQRCRDVAAALKMAP